MRVFKIRAVILIHYQFAIRLVFSLIIGMASLLTGCKSNNLNEHESGVSSLEGENIVLPVTEVGLSRSEILGLAALEIGDLIKKLRDFYQIKVLILDYNDSYPKAFYSDLQHYNLREDASAIAYYSSVHREKRLGNEASFVEAKTTFGAKDHLYSPGRPYENSNLILLHLNAEKNMLMHEIIHCLISRSRSSKTEGISFRNDIADKKSQAAAVFLPIFEELNNEARRQGGGGLGLEKAIQALSIQEVNEFVRTSIGYSRALSQYSNNSEGEEMDITRLMYALEKDIFSPTFMDRKEYLEVTCRAYFERNFQAWIANAAAEVNISSLMIEVFKSGIARKIVSKESKLFTQDYVNHYNRVQKPKQKEAQSWLMSVK